MSTGKYNKLRGKHVLVIGGTSGIGFSVAEASLEYGASVTVSSSSEARVKSALERLQASYPSGKVNGYACDLSKPSVEQDLEKLFEKTGKLNHIVFTAGDHLSIVPLSEITMDKIIKAGQVRCFASLLTAKVGSRYLESSPESSIVITSGRVADRPMPNWSMMAFFASGLYGMTRNLALDLKPIRVNLVSPGAVDTELWDTSMDAETKAATLEKFSQNLPTGKVGKPEEVAQAYLWLMQDSNVTGHIASSDGGALLV